TDFYIRQKNYQKALFFVNKALAIDNENQHYWKRYATINKQMNFYEEAEFGYRKAVEFGDFELDTWLFWVDITQFLGEFDSAIQTLIQAGEYFPDSYEIAYRLAGLYFMIQENENGKEQLLKGLELNAKQVVLMEELFPVVCDRKLVKKTISDYLKSK
ncbi:MAG: tetratricopeptide repeat protein, partial [Flavobacterium sp.]